jgi:lysyl-tRNA synthetase class 2
MVLKRVMGKASFATLQDGSGASRPISPRKSPVTRISSTGTLATSSPCRHAVQDQQGRAFGQRNSIRLLVKALRPLPEKFHGMADQEMKYRQRYVDLIVSAPDKKVFEKRIKMVEALRARDARRRLPRSRDADDAADPRRRGGTAFRTHHNALDMDRSCASRPSCT